MAFHLLTLMPENRLSNLGINKSLWILSLCCILSFVLGKEWSVHHIPFIMRKVMLQQNTRPLQHLDISTKCWALGTSRVYRLFLSDRRPHPPFHMRGRGYRLSAVQILPLAVEGIFGQSAIGDSLVQTPRILAFFWSNFLRFFLFF